MTPKNEPVAIAGLFTAIVITITAFTNFTSNQELALNGLALALATYIARSKVSPV